MDGEEIRKVVRETNYVTWRRQGGWEPLVITRAAGSKFWDASGREYLDFSSQLIATNLGHGNAAVADAIAKQARTLAYAAPGFATEPRAALSSALLGVLPSGLSRFFFSTSGTEANEAALKIARAVTGRSKVLARYRSYHGSTASISPRRTGPRSSGATPADSSISLASRGRGRPRHKSAKARPSPERTWTARRSARSSARRTT